MKSRKTEPKGIMIAWEMIRAKHGYTMKEMAELIGVTTQCYSYWVNGQTPVPPWMNMSRPDSIDCHTIRAEVGVLYHALKEKHIIND